MEWIAPTSSILGPVPMNGTILIQYRRVHQSEPVKLLNIDATKRMLIVVDTARLEEDGSILMMISYIGFSPSGLENADFHHLFGTVVLLEMKSF